MLEAPGDTGWQSTSSMLTHQAVRDVFALTVLFSLAKKKSSRQYLGPESRKSLNNLILGIIEQSLQTHARATARRHTLAW